MKSRAKTPEGGGREEHEGEREKEEEKEDDEEKGEEEEIKPVKGSSKSLYKGENCFLIFLYLGCICGGKKTCLRHKYFRKVSINLVWIY